MDLRVHPLGIFLTAGGTKLHKDRQVYSGSYFEVTAYRGGDGLVAEHEALVTLHPQAGSRERRPQLLPLS